MLTRTNAVRSEELSETHEAFAMRADDLLRIGVFVGSEETSDFNDTRAEIKDERAHTTGPFPQHAQDVTAA